MMPSSCSGVSPRFLGGKHLFKGVLPGRQFVQQLRERLGHIAPVPVDHLRRAANAGECTTPLGPGVAPSPAGSHREERHPRRPGGPGEAPPVTPGAVDVTARHGRCHGQNASKGMRMDVSVTL